MLNKDAKLLSPAQLAFVGDAVYSLKVRTFLAAKNCPADTLHKAAVEFVSAAAQAKAFLKIKENLTDEELDIFTRGRNYHTNNTPKSSSHAEYHAATGIEALFGFLHLTGQSGRADELFKIIIEE